MSVIPLRCIYQIKITLKGIRPPIWRRVLVRDDINLYTFHRIIQVAMGWEGSHHHKFISDSVQYGIVNDRNDMENERDYKLNKVLHDKSTNLEYDYNFSNGWIHKVQLEKIRPYATKEQLPSCIEGKRTCPPDDCGGTSSYQYFLDIKNNPEHVDYDLALEWLGDNYNSEICVPSNINQDLLLFFRKVV
jgi:hypothetical protein